MARKGNQQRNSLGRNTPNQKDTVSESVDVSLSKKKEKSKARDRKIVDGELSNGDSQYRSSSPVGERVNKDMGSGKRNKQRYGNVPCKDKAEAPNSVQSVHIESNVRDTAGGDSLSDASEPREDGMLFCGNNDSKDSGSSTAEGSFVDNVMENSGSSDVVPGWSLGALAFYVLEAANKWVEQQKPRLTTFATVICDTQNYVCAKTKIACPIIWTWILHFGKLMFLISMVWLDCSLRGLDSLLRLGTTSFCTVIWCSILSVTAMIGITKMLIIMVIAALVAIFISFALAILIIAILGTVILWLYGSFWTTGLVILIGGITFALRLERVALLVTTLYSMHCARSYIGWLGLFLGLNLSFISSDVLIHFLKDNINEHRSNSPPEQARQSQSRAGHFYGEPFYASPADDAFQSSSGGSADRSTGVPSTSGAETSEDEVVRLLQCNDHYSALGLTRFENIDVSLLKREYRKKAMLVHPDKNMGNEKAAEAFQKLQNAYEVLLDSLKRKTYDDELRREELLNYFRRFQNSSQKNGRHGIFSPGFTHSVDEDEGPHGESRKIACKKCSDFHIWTRIERSKSLARWCQDCNDFHQAKDGDGWVEQSSQPFLFGLLQKVDPPHAYVCAESRIYDATEWFICQGMSCPPNTHKPSFHVNTSIASKHNSSKGSSSTQRGGGERSTPNMDEPMTEEEFFEWLQNAMQSGMFEANSTSNESPTAKTASCSKSGLKKKRKGKKQW